MRKLFVAMFALLLWAPAQASALEIKNVRSIYGPFGSVRSDNKYLPGDTLWISYDIFDITIDPASGLARYTITLELFDAAKKSIFKNDTPTKVIATLGGNQLPGIATVTMGADQPSGAYQAKVTVTDGVTKASKDFTYAFELSPKTFGFVGVAAPASAPVGFETLFGVTLVGWERDPKKLPNIDITRKITDEAGKMTLSKPLTANVPMDLTEDFFPDGGFKSEILKVPLPVYLNRPGRFTVEIDAVDNTTKKTAKLKFSITVLDAK